MFEVEQKFRVTGFGSIEPRLVTLGCDGPETLKQVDRYLRHPSRDFASTDEALRLRRVGDDNYITYKGPKIDQETKTRREIELPMTSGSEWLGEYTELMMCLGFEIVAEVVKTRRAYHMKIDSWMFEVALDEVEEVGSFVELETSAEEAQLSAARAAMADLAGTLKLREVERCSYLGLLLKARGLE